MLYIILQVLNIIVFIVSIILSVVSSETELWILYITSSVFSFFFIFVYIRLNYTKILGSMLEYFPMKHYQAELIKANSTNNKLTFIYDKHSYKLIDNPNVEFKVGMTLFKQSFIIAFIVRNSRYGVVSNKLPLYNLYRKTLKVKKIKNLVIRFEKNNKVKEYTIIKDNISKYTFLAHILMCMNILIKTKCSTSNYTMFNVVNIDEYSFRSHL